MIRSLLLLSVLLFISSASAQLYGNNNCAIKNGDGNNNYCGPDPQTLCTPAQNEAAKDAFFGYIKNLETGDFTAMTSYTTGAGNMALKVPAFEFNWHGNPSIIPYAGTYTGAKALENFFSTVFKNTKDFTFQKSFYPPAEGLLIPAYNCQFLFAQWQENSVNTATGRTLSKGTNTVRYTFLNSTDPKIAVVDVFVNGGKYEDVNCPGQINCNGYTQSATPSTIKDMARDPASIAAAVLSGLIIGLLLYIVNIINAKRAMAAADSAAGTAKL